MKHVLVFCEGIREIRLIQAVIEYYKKEYKCLSGEEKEKAKESLEGIINKLLGKVEEIYTRDSYYVWLINIRGMFSKILTDKSLLNGFKELEKEENLKIVFVCDEEYKKLKNYFSYCVIFSKNIEDFILRVCEILKLNVDKLYKTFEKECKRYNHILNKRKIKVGILHLLLSGGECDKKMFSKIFKMIENKGIKVKEIEALKSIL